MAISFAASAVLLVWIAHRISSACTVHRGDHFWIAVGCGYLQLSAIPLLLSLFGALEAHWFIVVQALTALSVARVPRARGKHPADASPTTGLDALEWVMVLLILTALVIHCLHRVYTPLFKNDVLSYHASRPLYWIQNRSLAPYPTANYRHHAFSFGSDLIFLWPMLFMKSEFIARMVFWLGYPLTTLAFFITLRALRCSRKLSLLGGSVFVAIPIVYHFGMSLEPLIWVSFFSLGAGYWALRTMQTSAGSRQILLWFGIYAVLPGNAKNNALVLIPAAGVAVVLAALQSTADLRRQIAWKAIGIFLCSVCVAALMSGLVLSILQSTVIEPYAISAKLIAAQNIADISPYQLYVHSIRIIATLLEVPLPNGSQFLSDLGNRIIDLLGADKPLPKEVEWGWVDRYYYKAPEWPGMKSFGVAGLVLLVTLASAIVSGLRSLRIGGLSSRLYGLLTSGPGVYAVSTLPLLLASVYLLRWFHDTGSFLAPGVVCALALSFVHVDRRGISVVGRGLLFPSLLTISVLFTLSQADLLEAKMRRFGTNWSAIAYTRFHHHALIEESVPAHAELLLVVGANFSDYTAFGRGARRRVRHVVTPYTGDELSRFLTQHASAYVYVWKLRYQRVQRLLDVYGATTMDPTADRRFIEELLQHPSVGSVAEDENAVLLRIQSP
jgi:hypothetical protein